MLFGIDLAVYPGEIVAVIGPNGAGKTTLLNTISGVCRTFSGSISFKGQAITGLRPDQVVSRGIAHSPEGRRYVSSAQPPFAAAEYIATTFAGAISARMLWMAQKT